MTRRAAPHVLALALVVGVLVAVVPLDRPWTSDDGAYVAATRLVRDEGRWDDPAAPPEVASDPERYPLELSEVDESGRAFPYVKRPAWILVLVASTTLFGELRGFVVPGALAAVAAAALAWALARRLGSPRPWLAFWLVGLGPVLLVALGFWAHAPAAALGGVAALAAAALAVRRSPAVAVGLGVALGALVALRSEGLVAAAALLAVVGVTALRSRDGRRIVDAGLAGAVTVALFGLDRWWAASLVDGSTTTSGPTAAEGSWLAGRARAAHWVLTQGAIWDSGASLLVVVAGALAAAGVVVVAREGRTPRAVLLLGGAGLVLLVRVAGRDGDFVTGVLPAWPAMAGGLVAWVRARRRAGPAEVLLAAWCALGVAGVVLAQHATGGGLEWGARYLTPFAVPLGALAALGLERALEAGPEPVRPRARGLAAAVVGVGVVLAALGLHSTGRHRELAAGQIADVRALDADVAVTVLDHLPRVDVDPDDGVTWVRLGDRTLDEAVAAEVGAGARRIAVVGVDLPPLDLVRSRRVVVSDAVTLYVVGEG